jgi:hypothetical protein
MGFFVHVFLAFSLFGQGIILVFDFGNEKSNESSRNSDGKNKSMTISLGNVFVVVLVLISSVALASDVTLVLCNVWFFVVSVTGDLSADVLLYSFLQQQHDCDACTQLAVRYENTTDVFPCMWGISNECGSCCACDPNLSELYNITCVPTSCNSCTDTRFIDRSEECFESSTPDVELIMVPRSACSLHALS